MMPSAIGESTKVSRLIFAAKKNKKGAAEDKANENNVLGREKMATPCSRIALIDLPINEAIEKHRRGARRDHTSQD
jgi:hypothetical protein